MTYIFESNDESITVTIVAKSEKEAIDKLFSTVLEPLTFNLETEVPEYGGEG